MGHEKFKVEKVTLFEVGGRKFKTKEEAAIFEKELVSKERESKINKLKLEKLKVLAKSYSSINPYFSVLFGENHKGGFPDATLKSLILDSPNLMLKLLISLDEIDVDFKQDGVIKKEIPMTIVSEEESFILKIKTA